MKHNFLLTIEDHEDEPSPFLLGIQAIADAILIAANAATINEGVELESEVKYLGSV